ncbi:DUF3891 domain-containing protein, partial [Paenibacillus sp. 28ISP30-2]|nr:DUF3891 domain-containing protein [Paenibacillus sp. 28ISP30-2]
MRRQKTSLPFYPYPDIINVSITMAFDQRVCTQSHESPNGRGEHR